MNLPLQALRAALLALPLLPVLATPAEAASLIGSTSVNEGQFFRGGLSGSSGVAGGTVVLPNGKYSEFTEDLSVKVPGGQVRWVRDFNGNQWRFNPQWASLEFEFDEILLSATSSGAGGAALAVPTTPTEKFGGTRIPGTNGGLGPAGRGGPLWAISRNDTWFTVDASYCNFVVQNTARYLLKPVFNGDEPACPTNRFAGQLKASGGATGEGAALRLDGEAMPASLAGFRWEERGGSWIEFERSGRITGYGDRNNVKVSFRYSGGRMTGVLDHNGRLVMSIGYDGDGRIGEVRDVPGPGDTQAARVVRYTYDEDGSIASVTDVRGHVTRYGYDDKDRLTTVIDAEQRVRSLAYGPTNRVIKLTQPDGAATEYVYDYDKLKKQFFARIRYPEVDGQRREEDKFYDTEGRLVSTLVNGKPWLSATRDGRTIEYLDAKDGKTTVTLNEYGLLTSRKYADGSAISVNYEAFFLNPVSMTDENGTRTKMEYDAKGNPKAVAEAAGTPDERSTVIGVDALGQTTTLTRKGRVEVDGSVTEDAMESFEYDAQGNLAVHKDAEGHETRYEYERQGLVTRITEPEGGVWHVSYDAAGNILTLRDPNEHVTIYDYDKVGNLVEKTDARGKKLQYEYDPMNRLASQLTPANAVSGKAATVSYNKDGRLERLSDASAQGMRIKYDSFGRITRITDTRDVNIDPRYLEADGTDRGLPFMTTLLQPTMQRKLSYDARWRLSEASDVVPTPRGVQTRTEQYRYDSVGRLLEISDARGKKSRMRYDPHGDLREAIDPLNHSQSLGLSARGGLLRHIDARNHATVYKSDKRGLVTQETDTLGKATNYAYDRNGRLSEVRQPNGTRVTYHYDPGSRLIERRAFLVSDASATEALTQTDTFGYDSVDNITAWSTTTLAGVTKAELGYDEDGRLTQETVNYGSFSLSYSYSYEPNGQIKTLTMPHAGQGTRTLSYRYDAVGELESVQIPGEGEITVTEWDWSVPKRVLLPGGTEQVIAYDGTLAPTQISIKTPGQQTVLTLDSNYGLAGELIDQTRDGKLATYGYDDALRLTQVQREASGFGVTQQVTLDAAGNRTTQSGATVVPGDSRLTSGTWTYDDTNQLQSRGQIDGSGAAAVEYRYDEAGNLIERTDATQSGFAKVVTRYRYDAYNRLIEVTDGAGVPVARYGYDVLHRRVWKETYLQGVAKRTYFLNAAQGVLLEADGAGRVMQAYGWRTDQPWATAPMFVTQMGADGDGAPTDASRTLYYHLDYLSTPIALTDKLGKIVWRGEPDPFGLVADEIESDPPEGFAAIRQPWRYPGQYFDIESRFSYNWNRYYIPDAGRYLTKDPLGYAGSSNLYLYVGAFPTGAVDPYGLFSMDDVWGGVYSVTGGWSPSNSTVNFVSGWGDTLSFGVTDKVRRAFNIGSVDKCSAAYKTGEVVGFVHGMAIGWAGGTKAAAKAASTHNHSNFSHSLFPDRFLKKFDNVIAKWLNKRGNRVNGDFVSPELHTRMDKEAQFGLTREWLKENPLFNPIRQIWNRIPYMPGAAAFGLGSAYMNSCDCGN